MEEYIRRILKVLVFIEEHLEEEMTLEGLARVACYSPFHFHRLFQALVGETVHGYVKRLRMEKAAGKLRYTDQPVTDIALETQYDTPSAFTKAFRQSMGTTPKHYRALHAAIQQTLEELPMIQPEKITKTADMDLLFIRKVGNYAETPFLAWEALHAYIHANHLQPLRYFGLSHDDPNITSEEKLRFDAAILAPGVKERGEVGRQTLRGGKYAIFTHKGPYSGLEETFKSIFLKWLPKSNETFDETRLPFCEYFHMELVKTDPQKLLTHIYIPLK